MRLQLQLQPYGPLLAAPQAYGRPDAQLRIRSAPGYSPAQATHDPIAEHRAAWNAGMQRKTISRAQETEASIAEREL
jgi:hypothetical protein